MTNSLRRCNYWL